MKKRKMWSLMFVISVVISICGITSISESADVPKVLNLAISENALLLDPHNQTFQSGTLIITTVFEGLVREDREGGYFPLLAEKWESDPSGVKWRFYLRKGIKFHNGDPFDAKDAKLTFDRMLENVGKLFIATNRWNTLQSCEIVDDYTIDLIFKGPNPKCLSNLANTAIISNEAYEKDGNELWSKQMLYGTGPWLFEKWVDGQYAHFVKNQEYWNKSWYDSYYDEMYLRFMLDSSSAIAAHLAGDIQGYFPQTGVNKDLQSLFVGTEDRIEKLAKETSQVMFVGLNCAPDRVFSDKNVRMAFEYAIDREAIVRDVLSGEGVVPSSPITPPCFGYDPNLEPYVYDPDKAREFLKNSTYDGRKITLMTTVATKKGEDVCLSIAEYLNAVGFNCDIRVDESAASVQYRVTGNYDMYYILANHNGNDPTDYLNQRIYMDGANSSYKNPEMNGLIEKILVEMDTQKRDEYITRISHIIREEAAPHSAISTVNQVWYVDLGVTGINYFRDGSLRIMYATFDPSLLKKN